MNSPVHLTFFAGNFLMTNSIFLLVLGLLEVSISSWLNFGRLYVSRNCSIYSRLSSLLACNCNIPFWFFVSLWWASQVAHGKESTFQSRRHIKECRFSPWIRTLPWRIVQYSTPAFLPGESHGQRSLAGCSARTVDSDTTRVRHKEHTHC